MKLLDIIACRLTGTAAAWLADLIERRVARLREWVWGGVLAAAKAATPTRP